MTMIYTPQGWVDDDGSNTVGTLVTAGRMNAIEAGLADANARTRVVDIVSRYATILPSTRGADFDGVPPLHGMRVLLVAQAEPAENGIYTYQAGGTGTLIPAPDFAVDYGNQIHVKQGTLWQNSVWQRTYSLAGVKFGPCGGTSPLHLIGQPGEIPFLNGWANSGTTPMAWYVNNGRLYIRGSMSGGATTTAAFTLPAGPAVAEYQPVLQDSGAAGGYISLGTDGTLAGSRTTPTLYMDISFLIAV